MPAQVADPEDKNKLNPKVDNESLDSFSAVCNSTRASGGEELGGPGPPPTGQGQRLMARCHGSA